GEVGVTNECVIVEVHFAIYGNNFIICCFEEWIDLEHGAIESDVRVVKIGNEFCAALECFTFKAEVESDLSCLEGLEAAGGVYPFFEDLLGCIMSNILDIHSTFGAVHDHVLSFCSVEENGEVEFFSF